MDGKLLKESFDKVLEFCDVIEENAGFKKAFELEGDGNIRNLLTMEVVRYLGYLAASDGVISYEDSQFIGMVTGIRILPSKLKEYILENNIYSREFEEKVPIVLQIFVSWDNAAFEQGIGKDTEQTLGGALWELYRFLTVGMIEANGRDSETMMESESEDAETYLHMLKSYINENTRELMQDAVFDHPKEGGAIDG